MTSSQILSGSHFSSVRRMLTAVNNNFRVKATSLQLMVKPEQRELKKEVHHASGSCALPARKRSWRMAHCIHRYSLIMLKICSLSRWRFFLYFSVQFRLFPKIYFSGPGITWSKSGKTTLDDLEGLCAHCFKVHASFGTHNENLNEGDPLLSATKM